MARYKALVEGIGHIILTYRTEEEEGKEVAKGRKGGGELRVMRDEGERKRGRKRE